MLFRSAQILLEQGYKVYIVDRPGQGRVPYHPWLHGNYSARTQTFEEAATEVRSTQWPGTGTPDSPEVAQFVAASCQAMPRGTVAQETWTSRGVILLEDIGPSIFITHGDGAAFAIGTAARGQVGEQEEVRPHGAQQDRRVLRAARLHR